MSKFTVNKVTVDRLAYEKALADCMHARQAAYVAEADPIFFDIARGKATTDDWNAKVDEIKARFPKP
jgi:hypothetical protein